MIFAYVLFDMLMKMRIVEVSSVHFKTSSIQSQVRAEAEGVEHGARKYRLRQDRHVRDEGGESRVMIKKLKGVKLKRTVPVAKGQVTVKVGDATNAG